MFQHSSKAVHELMSTYDRIMTRSANHIDAYDAIHWDFSHLSPDELKVIGQVFLSLADWKQSSSPETLGVTPDNQAGVRALGDEFPSHNQVTEFPEVA